jgi:hypothetical protein
MVQLTKKHRDKLIGGLITILLLALGLWVKNIFQKENVVKQTTNINSQSQNPVISAHSLDSSKQNISLNQITQTNSNKGNVNNQFIAGDKKIYNTTKSKEEKKDAQIINSGFVNNGGVNNTYNQTINPKPVPREVMSVDIKNIQERVPINYTITVMFSSSDKECKNFGYELVQQLRSFGYSTVISTYGILGSTSYNDRFELTVNESTQEAHVLIYVLQE